MRRPGKDGPVGRSDAGRAAVAYGAAVTAEDKWPVQGLAPLLGRIRARFPDLAWTDARLIDTGWDHEVVVLDERVVFRFPNERYYLDVLGVEIAVLDALRGRVEAATPHYRYVALEDGFAGYPMISGSALTGSAFPALGEADRERFTAQLAGVLTALHTTTAAEIDVGAVPPSELPEEHEQVAEVARAQLPKLLSRREMTVVEGILDDATDLLVAAPPTTVLLHGDVYPEHLLWDPAARRLGLIDFSDLCTGDPAFDFAEIGEYGEDFRAAVFDRYAGPKDGGLLERARRYERWVAVYMLTDHFLVGKTSFTVAREMFDHLGLGD